MGDRRRLFSSASVVSLFALCTLAGCVIPGGTDTTCPTKLAVQLLSSGDVRISWDPTDGSDGTNVWRKINGGDWELGEHIDGNATGETVDKSTHTPGWTYAYTVRATAGFNESKECPEQSVTIPGGTSTRPPPTEIPFFPSTTSLVLASTGAVLGVLLVLRRKR